MNAVLLLHVEFVAQSSARMALTPSPSPEGRGERRRERRLSFLPSPTGRGVGGEGRSRLTVHNKSQWIDQFNFTRDRWEIHPSWEGQ
jgi:hypothetical protein